MGFLMDFAKGFAHDVKDEVTKSSGKKTHAQREFLTVEIDESGPVKRVMLVGSSPVKVYTYYPEVIANLPFGKPFHVEAILNPMTLVSPKGGKWSTKSRGVALSYDGYVFGAFNQKEYMFKELNEDGLVISLVAVKSGIYDFITPEVTLMCPHGLSVRHWRESCKRHDAVLPFDEDVYLNDGYKKYAEKCAKELIAN